MHELGRAKAVLSEALARAEGKRIKSLSVRLTPSHGEEDAEEFRFLFEAEAKRTSAVGAKLEITFVKNGYSCKECGNKEDGLSYDVIRCSKCGSPDIEQKPSHEIVKLVF